MEDIGQKPWLVKLGVTLWVSFIWAGIATMLFFSTFNPVEITKIATFSMEISISQGYSIGFLLFWLLLVINSVFINWLSSHTSHMAPR